jgi:protein TonB
VSTPQPQIADVFTGPELIRRVDPPYPQAALVADVRGDVILEGVVGEDGKVRDIVVVRSVHPLLDATARKAFGEFQYKPARRNGTPEPHRLQQTFRFKPE